MFLSRRNALALAAAPLAAARGWAWAPGDFWNDRPPADWSDKDIQKLLSKSPWAKEVKAEFDAEAMMEEMKSEGGPGGGGPGGGGGMGGPPGGGMGGPGGGGGMGGPPGGGMGGPGGGMGGPGGGMGGPGGMEGEESGVKVLVRWETAQPVRDGVKKALPSETENHYGITVAGLPMMGGPGGRRGGPGGAGDTEQASPEGPAQNRRLQRRRGEGAGEEEPGPNAAQREERRKRMLARMMRSTSLSVKGKDPIAPDGVIVSDDEKGTLLLLFPKPAAPIAAGDKEVAFQTRMGPLVVKTKFSLKEMVYRGQLAL